MTDEEIVAECMRRDAIGDNIVYFIAGAGAMRLRLVVNSVYWQTLSMGERHSMVKYGNLFDSFEKAKSAIERALTRERKMTEISKTISVPDITARVDELRKKRADHDKALNAASLRDDSGALTEAYRDDDGEPSADMWESENTDEAEELARLEKLLDDLRGRGTSCLDC
jgi:DNA-directed RNA polymerase sigma subunit (sigma70/sigma32)